MYGAARWEVEGLACEPCHRARVKCPYSDVETRRTARREKEKRSEKEEAWKKEEEARAARAGPSDEQDRMIRAEIEAGIVKGLVEFMRKEK